MAGNSAQRRIVVTRPTSALDAPVPESEFVEAVIKACDVLFGRVTVKLRNARGFQVPTLAPDAPLNQSLLVLQTHLNQLGLHRDVVLAAVQRFLALIQSPLNAPELGALVVAEKNCAIVGMTVKLIRAAASASMADMDPTKPEFRPVDLCNAAALLRDAE